MRRTYYAEKSCDWENYLEEFLKDGKVSMWASVKVTECYSQVELEDEGRVSIAQDIIRVWTLRRIIAPRQHKRSHIVVRVSSLPLIPA